MTYNKGYVVLIARTIDILTCTWITRDYDLTLSSVTGLEMRKPNPKRWARTLNAFLNWLEPGHCEGAIKADIERAQEALRILNGT